MPLRDHFHAPLDTSRRWQAIHAMWPATIIPLLNAVLPENYYAEPRVQLGNRYEIDIGTFAKSEFEASSPYSSDRNGGLATVVWAPPKPTLIQEAEFPVEDQFEVLIFDAAEDNLVAAIEIVSPANKDRPESRSAFVDKCYALLVGGVSVAIVDVVSNHHFNLYRELIEIIGLDEPDMKGESIYAVSCRSTPQYRKSLIENWEFPLGIGKPLPTLPLWLSETTVIPVDLEESYETTCRTIRLP